MKVVLTGELEKLDERSKLVLQVLRDKGIVSGVQLQALTNLSAGAEVRDAVKPLIRHKLIGVSGLFETEQQMRSVQFSYKPSMLAVTEMLLAQS